LARATQGRLESRDPRAALRVDILGVGCDRVTAREALERILSFWDGTGAGDLSGTASPRGQAPPGAGTAEQGCFQVVTLNPEMIMAAQRDPALRDALNASALTVPDGIGVVWASRLLGDPLPERVAGIDLAEAALEAAAREGRTAFFLGAEPGVAEAAAERLCRRIPGLRVTGVHHGYFSEAENEAVLSMIAERAPDLLLVGLGAPKQELWIHRHRDRLRARVAMGVGGALDVFAGRVRRAPRLWQKLGLEWAYRLVQQPRRFRRTLVLPRFAWAVLRRRLYRSIPGE